MLAHKKILLGVCGSIAAYKSAFLVRLLTKARADVRVVMTEMARTFVGPLTFSTLSKNPVLTAFSDDAGSWNSHVEVALWADLFVIAPASAHTLARLSNGLCDNLLAAIYLSAKCPVMLAPAMDLDMWHHPATQKNLAALQERGHEIIPVGTGELASGLKGEGRMAEPEEILAQIEKHFKIVAKRQRFYGDITGKKVLITAGPTVEPIDPVRYISNHSTGKMGFALAEEFAALGAEVVLIKGPTSYNPSLKEIKVIPVTTAQEMYDATMKEFADTDITIMAAAVSDYRPVSAHKQKLKKTSEVLKLELIKNPDILETLGKRKKGNQILVGFALETENEIANAKKKLQNKNLDLIVLNSLRDQGAGFGHDTNKVTILNRKNEQKTYTLKGKPEVARDLIEEIINLMNGKKNAGQPVVM
ncbi:MAG: phosphopantothenoylcysteine decarboxylase [Chitinophagales bacterium]|nr:MAG: phosphopantothenoylcysteine decarboxylase [Chitinophagales bacterium]